MLQHEAGIRHNQLSFTVGAAMAKVWKGPGPGTPNNRLEGNSYPAHPQLQPKLVGLR